MRVWNAACVGGVFFFLSQRSPRLFVFCVCTHDYFNAPCIKERGRDLFKYICQILSPDANWFGCGPSLIHVCEWIKFQTSIALCCSLHNWLWLLQMLGAGGGSVLHSSARPRGCCWSSVLAEKMQPAVIPVSESPRILANAAVCHSAAKAEAPNSHQMKRERERSLSCSFFRLSKRLFTFFFITETRSRDDWLRLKLIAPS